ncbi:MAG: hypothetical protein KF908_04000 [Nitrosomonas sp.]|nr:hypothetical protein [Nitrosomonas sp.]
MEGTSGGRAIMQGLSPEQRLQDGYARQMVSRELGHDWVQITAVYCGR